MGIRDVKDGPDREGLGRRIAEARQDMDMSQAELARRIGVSAPTVGNWEGSSKANRVPSAFHLIKLARVLRVRPEWLVEGGQRIPFARLSDVGKVKEDLIDEALLRETCEYVYRLAEEHELTPSEFAEVLSYVYVRVLGTDQIERESNISTRADNVVEFLVQRRGR